jgi:hypothetical protein
MFLLWVEVGIAVFVKDGFVRPFVGDYLVVILMYYFFASFLSASIYQIAGGVLVFAYLIETLQYFHFIRWMGWEKQTLLRIILGSSFHWGDIIAYTLGILSIIIYSKKTLKHGIFR